MLHEVYTHTAAGQSMTERRGIGIWNPGKRDSNLNLVAVSPKCSSLGTQTLCEAARQIASIPTLGHSETLPKFHWRSPRTRLRFITPEAPWLRPAVTRAPIKPLDD